MTFKVSPNPNHTMIKSWAYHLSNNNSLEQCWLLPGCPSSQQEGFGASTESRPVGSADFRPDPAAGWHSPALPWSGAQAPRAPEPPQASCGDKSGL